MTRKRIAIIGGSLFAALVLLWALAGWLWLPAFVKREAPKALAATGHVLRIGGFEFNPFTLKAVATDIAIANAQGKPVFAVAQVLADLEWRSLTRLAAVFSELSITRPELDVDIDPEGRVNLAALAGPDRPEQPARGLPRVLIGRLAIEEGSIAFADRREGYSNRVEHLALDLGEVSTLEAEEGRLRLAAQTHDGARLAWEGTLSLQPLAAAGTLELKALPLPSLMPGSRPCAKPGACIRFRQLGRKLRCRDAACPRTSRAAPAMLAPGSGSMAVRQSPISPRYPFRGRQCARPGLFACRIPLPGRAR